MKDRLVTLIGGGGFLGRYVAQALLTARARVRIAQRDPRQAFYLKTQGGLGQTQFVAVDVKRPETVVRAVQNADSVVNLTGTFGRDQWRVHVDGARAVAKAAADAGVEALVHVSAIGADPTSRSAYGRSKGEGEAAVRDAFPQATIVRPSVIFGPEDAFLNRFAAMAARFPVVPVIRAGARFQPVFVYDVAQAIANAATAPAEAAGGTFELGGPEVMTMGQIVRWIAHTLHRAVPVVDLPDAFGAAIARGGALPGAPLSWDQWLMLQHDNVVGADARGLAALGVAATPLASVAPDWLVRYRRQGRFNRRPEELAPVPAALSRPGRPA